MLASLADALHPPTAQHEDANAAIAARTARGSVFVMFVTVP
jgi:hypothetical protein